MQMIGKATVSNLRRISESLQTCPCAFPTSLWIAGVPLSKLWRHVRCLHYPTYVRRLSMAILYAMFLFVVAIGGELFHANSRKGIADAGTYPQSAQSEWIVGSFVDYQWTCPGGLCLQKDASAEKSLN